MIKSFKTEKSVQSSSAKIVENEDTSYFRSFFKLLLLFKNEKLLTSKNPNTFTKCVINYNYNVIMSHHAQS